MAVVHRTTLTPTKLELLRDWLPAQPWYPGERSDPAKAGGFRLDDPQGEVGIEFMVVTDGGAAYHVPLTYRGAPLEGARDALVGTAEHGVLGRRWVYDGTRDPVLVAQLLALLAGTAEPQQQSVSDTPDPSVLTRTAADPGAAVASFSTAHGPDGTGIDLETTAGDRLALRVARALTPAPDAAGHVCATWRTPDGTEHRAPFVTVV
ncbi:1,4-alpha-glucan branching protein [Nocardiopsis sp. CC223A]|uniref:maltokinase N-terminal cap-like domain-containing protein n=1 Tax=Nocardiopsis sp. CC223A TaxID=3044051 RepID=UPI002795EE5B|nr:1,4-alpha-glucan branching protein [Nocardiopsis sp. CC223A]